eukprot:6747313-Pyramimonas_sp.AAC.1
MEQATEAEEIASLDRVLTRLALTEEDKIEKVVQLSEPIDRICGPIAPIGSCRTFDDAHTR